MSPSIISRACGLSDLWKSDLWVGSLVNSSLLKFLIIIIYKSNPFMVQHNIEFRGKFEFDKCQWNLCLKVNCKMKNSSHHLYCIWQSCKWLDTALLPYCKYYSTLLLPILCTSYFYQNNHLKKSSATSFDKNQILAVHFILVRTEKKTFIAKIQIRPGEREIS